MTTLKVGLASHLEKQGSSLLELEENLGSLDKAASAARVVELLEGLQKVAYFGEDALGQIGSGLLNFGGNVAKAIPEVGLTTALLTGSAVGAGAYGLKKHVDNQDKELDERNEEIRRIKMLTERLKQDYGLAHHGQE